MSRLLFIELARVIDQERSRRRLLGALAGLGLGGVLTLLETGDAGAEKPKDRLQRRVKQRRRKRRNERRRNGNQGGGGKGGVGAADCTVCAQGCAFGSIQAAIDAANAGDTVTVCTGTYKEDVSITKNLTLRGVNPNQVSIIAGTGKSSVVSIAQNVTVTIQRMAIGLGIGTPFPDRVGGGVFNQGTLTLDFVDVGENTADRGGGIYNDVGATLFVTNQTSIGNNTARQRGGGIFNDGGGQVTIDSRSDVGGNRANEGGGIYAGGGSTVLLRGGATVVSNTATAGGGGIYNDGDLTVDAAVVQGNTATDNGGGILQHVGQTTLRNGAVIDQNTARNGGGVHLQKQNDDNVPSLTLNDSAISNNLVSEGGGGIFNEDGVVTLQASTVFSNTATQGGGIFNTSGGTVSLDAESAVFENSPNNCIGTSACTA